MDMTVEQSLEQELQKYPEAVRNGPLAATAMVLARKMDDPDNSATSVSMCANAMLSIMTKLADAKPAEQQTDSLAKLLSKRQSRRGDPQPLRESPMMSET